MPAPKITLKQLMLLMILVAVFMAVLSLAVRGSTVALGIAISAVGLVVLFQVYQLAFLALYSIGRISQSVQRSPDGKRTGEKP